MDPLRPTGQTTSVKEIYPYSLESVLELDFPKNLEL